MDHLPFRRWALLSLLNFCILAAVGVLLRYKIIFSLPMVHQKNLLHGHSHFAFSGWVGMALFTGIVWVIYRHHKSLDLQPYKRLFWLGQMAAFGMLCTFPFMGYKWPSIALSTLSVVFSYLFAWRAWKDMRQSTVPLPVAQWFRASFVMLGLSTLGTFFLAWLMMQKGPGQEWYIGSVYFFLHFQYNGWFLFAILGFFYYFISRIPYQAGCHARPQVFRYLVIASIPAYFLSALWMRLPSWMYWSAVASGLLQLVALYYFSLLLFRCVRGTRAEVSGIVKWLWGFALLAFILKILMQALSVIPAVTHLAFGFRPIVIGYLHMVLLGLVSFFLLGFLVQEKLIDRHSKTTNAGFILFISAVVLNEILLMLQGVRSIWMQAFPYANQLLFGVAIMIFTGLLLIIIGQRTGTGAVDRGAA
jgi:hypothetical protein